MKALLALTVLVITFGCYAQGQVSPPYKPWARHCTLSGIVAADPAGMDYFASLAKACDPRGACVLACARSGCARGIAGGCAHVCSRGLPQDLAIRADHWSALPVCVAPSNNSFKPKPLRGSAQFRR